MIYFNPQHVKNSTEKNIKMSGRCPGNVGCGHHWTSASKRDSTYSRATSVWPLLEVYCFVLEVDHPYYVPSKREVNLCPSLYSLTEVILQLTMISLPVRGWFISRKMIHNPAKIRVIKYPMVDRLIIVSWRMTSVRLYSEGRRLTTRLLGMYPWEIDLCHNTHSPSVSGWNIFLKNYRINSFLVEYWQIRI